MSDFPPLKLSLPYPILGQGELNTLTLPALLWALRHGFCGFEAVVHYAECHFTHYPDDLLLPLASLVKNDYDEHGPALLNELVQRCVVDERQAHASSAEELFSLLFHTLHQQGSAPLLAAVIKALSGEMQFSNEAEWIGEPLAPYTQDTGPSAELITRVVLLRVQLEKQGVTPAAWQRLAELAAR